MSNRTVKSTIAVLFLSLVAGASIAAGAVRSKDFTCQELRTLVVEREKVKLKGFLGTRITVHSEARGCDIVHEVPFPSSWRAKDHFSCVVGFRCERRIDLEDTGF